MLVKRLVCIEDLGDVDVLLTDKTGTLTEGRIGFLAALDTAGRPSQRVLLLGLLATEGDRGVGSNALDVALWAAPGAATAAVPEYRRLGVRPFDHDRLLTSSLVDDPDGPRVVVKGAPEAVLARCRSVPDELRAQLDAHFAAGSRVVAVATRSLTAALPPGPAWEQDLDGADPPQPHPPFYSWTRKVNGKTVTRRLSADQLRDYQPWFDNARRLRALTTDLEDLSLRVLSHDPRWGRK